MKKLYVTMELEVVTFMTSDVLTSSTGKADLEFKDFYDEEDGFNA